MIEKLKECRFNPRKLQEKYLKDNDILPFIDEKTSDPSFHKFKLKEKIDYIIHGCIDEYCYCGNRVKPGGKFCSGACVGKSPEVKSSLSKKQKENKIERYHKTKKTWMEKYGVEHNLSVPHIQKKVKNKRLIWEENTYRETFAKYNLDYDKLQDLSYLKTIINECVSLEHLSNEYFNKMPKMTLYRFIMRTVGNVSYKRSSSAGERELSKYIESLGEIVVNNSRTIIDNRELDIFLPERNIAIEYHGLYWHSGLENKKIHMEKLNKCSEKNITLYQFFDDEWEYKTDIIKSIISSKLGHNKKIYARKCVLKEVASDECKIFLEDNHLQGYIGGHSFGLYHENLLVSLFVIGKSRFKNKDAPFELLRYASKNNITVVGGFSKLLSHFKKKYDNSSMITYCDLRYSSGKTYDKFGTFIRKSQQNYFWWNKNKRVTRYQSQKHKLEKLLPIFDPKLTEQENMINNGYVQIWDVGNSVYIL